MLDVVFLIELFVNLLPNFITSEVITYTKHNKFFYKSYDAFSNEVVGIREDGPPGLVVHNHSLLVGVKDININPVCAQHVDCLLVSGVIHCVCCRGCTL